jgi:four helix bundle protein
MADGGWQSGEYNARSTPTLRSGLRSRDQANMSESNFRKLEVWQMARRLTREIYRATQQYPRIEMFGLVQQMRRAAVSVLSNIAEGQGRRTHADAKRFALIARGSLLELEAQLVISGDLEYVSQERAEELVEQTIKCVRKVNALIRYHETADQ